MSHLTIRLATIVLATLLPLMSATLTGPVSGFVCDATARGIRPVLGIPGASYLGATVVSELDFCSVGPNGRTAVALENGRWVLYPDLAASSRRIELGAGRRPELVAWRADSAKIALYDAESGVATIYHDAIDASACETIDLAYLGKVTRIALGDNLVSAVPSEAGVNVFLSSSESGTQQIGTAGRVDALVAIPGRTEVLALDGEAREILRMQAGESPTVAYRGHAVAEHAVAVTIVDNAQRLFSVSGKGRYVRAFDLTNGSVLADLELGADPTAFSALNSRGLFVLTQLQNNGPLLLLDTRDTGAIYFVPGAAN